MGRTWVTVKTYTFRIQRINCKYYLLVASRKSSFFTATHVRPLCDHHATTVRPMRSVQQYATWRLGPLRLLCKSVWLYLRSPCSRSGVTAHVTGIPDNARHGPLPLPYRPRHLFRPRQFERGLTAMASMDALTSASCCRSSQRQLLSFVINFPNPCYS